MPQLTVEQLDSMLECIEENRDLGALVPYLIPRFPGLNERITICDNCYYHFRHATVSRVINEYSEPELWCRRCLRSAYRWNDGTYHTTPLEIIPNYHSTRLNISEDILSNANVLGIELETYQVDIEGCAKKFSELRDKWNEGVKFERDGSLDDECGVEIVAKPFTLEQIKCKESSPWHEILEWSRNSGAEAWDAENSDGYGMHISLNASELSSDHCRRISRFINNNPDFCKVIAGRNGNSCTNYLSKDEHSWDSEYEEKYQAACVRDGRIEIRIFRASLHWERFIRNCEFADALRVYTSACYATPNALSPHSFKSWLTNHQEQYPLLSKAILVEDEVYEKLMIVE